MAELSPRDAHRMARRLYLIQVLLNYRTMQGTGYLFALWPWLKDRESRARDVRDAAGYINSHPVFASFAVGAMRRWLDEAQGHENSTGGSSELATWKETLAGPLGVTGDALIWDRWKPLVFAAGAWLMLLTPSVGFWIVTAALCLLAYNAPLYALRVWGVRRGYELGTHVLDALRDERFGLWRRRLTAAGVVLAGGLTATAVLSSSQGDLLRGAQFVVALGVMLLGLRFRLSAALAAVLAVVAALVFPMFP